MVNYGIAIELHNLCDIDEENRKRIEKAVTLVVGRALVVAEQKVPVGPYKVHVRLSNREMDHDEDGDVILIPPALHVVIEAQGEAKIIFSGKPN